MLEAGGDIFHHDTAIVHGMLSYLHPTWITSLVGFLATNGIRLNLQNTTLPLQRDGDTRLMEDITQRHPAYSTATLRAVNRVRLHLRVYSRSCITNKRTNTICDWALYPRYSDRRRKSLWNWPDSTSPTSKDWNIWRTVLAETYGPSQSLGERRYSHQRWNIERQPFDDDVLSWHQVIEGPVTVTAGNQTFSTDSEAYEGIYNSLYGKNLTHFIRIKQGWRYDLIDRINWEASEKCLGRLPLEKRTTRLKAIHGWLATAGWKAKLDESCSGVCGLCGAATETNEHLWVCVETREQREMALWAYIEKLHQKGTAGIIVQVWESRIKTLFGMAAESVTGDAADPVDAITRDATAEQDEIGWHNFLRGRQSLLWKDAQAEFFAQHGAQTADKRAQRKKKAGRWSREIMEDTLQLLTSVWIDRNAKIHRSTAENPAAKVTFIHERVAVMYTKVDSFRHRDRARLFGKPMEDRLQDQPFAIVKWLETADIVLRETEKKRHTLYRYFDKGRPPDGEEG